MTWDILLTVEYDADLVAAFGRKDISAYGLWPDPENEDRWLIKRKSDGKQVGAFTFNASADEKRQGP